MMKARKSTQVKTISDPVSAFCTTILNTTTQRAYRTDLRSFVEWLEAKYAEVFDIASITPSDVHVYKQDLIREGRSPATVNRALVSIGKFAKWCVTQDMRQDNFATRIPDCAWRSCVT
ncbi:MAG: site-specific integrase [Anaerolineae bacterium]|nr:site-specific integrase [Anaerolineae bacterium]